MAPVGIETLFERVGFAKAADTTTGVPQSRDAAAALVRTTSQG
jgi:hypothetical protein